VTHLRKMMLEELQRRHYSEATTRRYIRFIERFAQHFHCSPDRLGPRHIREYQAQLFTVRKLETSIAPTAHPLWRCPKCGGPMAIIERFTAAQLQLRSPPLLATAA
jgi:hypothetical protein